MDTAGGKKKRMGERRARTSHGYKKSSVRELGVGQRMGPGKGEGRDVWVSSSPVVVTICRRVANFACISTTPELFLGLGCCEIQWGGFDTSPRHDEDLLCGGVLDHHRDHIHPFGGNLRATTGGSNQRSSTDRKQLQEC